MKDKELDWPFADPKNVAVFTTESITSLSKPILRGCHDEDDGAWQFLDGQTAQADAARLVSLEYISQLDETVLELADLLLGWIATRPSKNSPWRRQER